MQACCCCCGGRVAARAEAWMTVTCVRRRTGSLGLDGRLGRGGCSCVGARLRAAFLYGCLGLRVSNVGRCDVDEATLVFSSCGPELQSHRQELPRMFHARGPRHHGILRHCIVCERLNRFQFMLLGFLLSSFEWYFQAWCALLGSMPTCPHRAKKALMINHRIPQTLHAKVSSFPRLVQDQSPDAHYYARIPTIPPS